MFKSYKEWVKDGSPKIFCDCPCHQEIIIKLRNCYRGMPRFIRGHNSRGINHPMYGKHHTDTMKNKSSISHKNQISPMKDKRHTEESKQKNRDKHLGKNIAEKHWNWCGGITEINHAIRSSNKYNNWRTQIFDRDNFTCQECRKRGYLLEAHHIKQFSYIINDNNIKTLKDALNCDELWNLNNGVTLCESCHNKTNNYGRPKIEH